MLIEDKPDTCIIHAGANSLLKSDPEEITSDILNTVDICKSYGVNDVYVSGITYRENFQEKVSETNSLLHAKQTRYGFTFIDNENINATHTWKDNIHLNDRGTAMLANNFIRHINSKSTA